MAAVYVGQTQGTVRPTNPFNPEEDAKRLRKAMKGFGKLTLTVCSASAFTISLLHVLDGVKSNIMSVDRYCHLPLFYIGQVLV